MCTPACRPAYQFPASKISQAGDAGADSPWFGMRVRLRSSYNCNQLQRAARIICVALQTYGGIYADHGNPWYFSGEATTRWDAVVGEVMDLKKIPSSFIDVVDTGGALPYT